MTKASDRRVHGLDDGETSEVVRYDRAGRWYLEPKDKRVKRRIISVREAAMIARLGTAHKGLPGGKRFDKLVG